MQNIWIVYSSRKGGHKYTTQSIVNYLKKYHNDKFNTEGINFLDYSPLASFFDIIGRYGDLKFRKIWKFGYKNLRRNSGIFLSL